MDIELIEDNKDIISDTSIKLWKSDPVFEKLYNITNKAFIKDRSTVFENREALSKELDHIIKQVFEQGYYEGLRERGEQNGKNGRKELPVNNWDASKVYPEGSVID